MRLGIAWKLTLSYLLITLGALFAAGYLFFDLTRQQLLGERQVAVLTQANMVAVSIASEPGWPLSLQGGSAGPVLTSALRSHSRQTGARLLLLDSDGLVLADSTGSRPGAAGSLVGRSLSEPVVAAAAGGRQQTSLRRLEDGGWVMYAAVPLVEGEQVVGVLLVSQSVSDIAANLLLLARRLLLIVAASSLVVVVLSLMIGRRLTRPLAHLTRATQRMAGGDLAQQVTVTGSDELADLGRAFNQMAAQLRSADEARRQFIGDASHEMRTPLATIKMLTDNLQQVVQEKSAREYLTLIDRQVDRLTGLVGSLLTLTRLDQLSAAAGQVRRELVNLEAALGRVVSNLSPAAQEKGVYLHLSLPGKTLWLEGDEEGLYRLFSNLVENGIRYTPAGGRVEVSARDDGDGWCQVQVSDTGAGIDPQDQPRVFDRFYRGDPARARRSGGFGLGLAIVKQIVELHGGAITLDSTPGAGTTFTVRLPTASGQVISKM